jgi:hypothetical protein
MEYSNLMGQTKAELKTGVNLPRSTGKGLLVYAALLISHSIISLQSL